ncbi:MAG: bile acid:sodium symporter family protein [Halieaceae bacterium]|nr:bile acid:sodium symporter family protein [Halieaceae bacterium]
MGEIYIKYEYWIAAFQLVFAMFGMGATLTIADFKDVIREPRAVSFGIAIQLILVPLIALFFIRFSNVSAGVAIGIAVIAAIPGGTTSNIFTHLARGNVPLSISITGLTTLACLISTPLILGLLITEYMPGDFAMPTGQIVNDIALTLLLPLAMGMIILRYVPGYARSISNWSIRASLFGILLIVVGSASAGRLDIGAFGEQNFLLVCAFVIILSISSWAASRLLRFSLSDSTAIEMEIIVRNVNLGVLIKATMFPAIAGNAHNVGDMVLFTLLLYGGLQLVFAAIVITLRRRRSSGIL